MAISLESLTRSFRARQLGIDNTPPESALVLFPAFKEKVLEPLCEKFGTLAITSGYRCHALNTAVGGSATSEHVWSEEGIAADFTTPQHPLEEAYQWIAASNLPFDQCILEHEKGTDPPQYRCIHISYRPHDPRQMAGRGGTHNSTRYAWDRVGPLDELDRMKEAN